MLMSVNPGIVLIVQENPASPVHQEVGAGQCAVHGPEALRPSRGYAVLSRDWRRDEQLRIPVNVTL
jgi:hypothetical protein